MYLNKRTLLTALFLPAKQNGLITPRTLSKRLGYKKVMSIVLGGESALDSQYNGLAEAKRLFPNDVVTVLIHDGVRPLCR